MAEVRPFRALRYNPAVVGDLSRVLCPPYDVISPQGREELYALSVYNVVRLEFGRPETGDDANANVYTRAAGLLQQWRKDGALARDGAPACYLMAEEHQQGGVAQTRLGLLAAVRLEEYDRGIVLPHEQTRPGPKEDRLRLMQACQAVFSPLMALYRDPGSLRPLLFRLRDASEPELATGEGPIRYRLWAIRDPAAIKEIGEAFAGASLYLVDGHHRYETALTYRDAQRSQARGQGPGTPASDFALMALIELRDPGFQLLSFHRLLQGMAREEPDLLWYHLRDLFEVEPRGFPEVSAAALEEFLRELETMDPDTPTFGLLDATTGLLYRLTLRPDAPAWAIPTPPAPLLRRCETWVLHQALGLITGEAADEPAQVSFLHDLDEVAGQVESGACQMVFLVRPMKLDLFEALVQQGQRLPPKTTYFAPKLPTGLVMHALEGELLSDMPLPTIRD